MRINPTYTVANEMVTTMFIPPNRHMDCVQAAAAVFLVGTRPCALFGLHSWQGGLLVYVLLWGFYFLAYRKDRQWLKLMWRALHRAPVICPCLLSKEDLGSMRRA